jgi:AcrR family transcriptional regulator
MCPRPRETTDAAILEATARAISQFGPARLTLAHVAAEVGVAPATLLQRFGSKRGLLLALAQHGAATTGQEYAAIRAAHASPLAALFAIADCMAGMASTPESLANHVAFLHIDLTDSDFHELALSQAHAARTELQLLLDAAVKVGELVPCDTLRLARAVQITLGGSLLAWAIERQGTARDCLRDDLEMLLTPYRRVGKAGRGHRSRAKPRAKRGS